MRGEGRGVRVRGELAARHKCTAVLCCVIFFGGGGGYGPWLNYKYSCAIFCNAFVQEPLFCSRVQYIFFIVCKL